jgi:hypothetical protein
MDESGLKKKLVLNEKKTVRMSEELTQSDIKRNKNIFSRYRAFRKRVDRDQKKNNKKNKNLTQ